MKKNVKVNRRNNRRIVKDMINYCAKFSSESILRECICMDFLMLHINKAEDAMKFKEEYEIIPGYNLFINTLLFLVWSNKKRPEISKKNFVTFDRLIEEMINKNNAKKGTIVLNEIINAQSLYQQKYIFKSYLLYLILNEPQIINCLSKFNGFNALDNSAVCLFNIITSEPTTVLRLCNCGITPSKIVDRFRTFLVDHYQYITIELSEFQKKQKKNLKRSKWDFFSTRLLIKDYPIICLPNGEKVISSYFNIQNSIYSRTIYRIKKENSAVLGAAYEKVIFDIFKNNYKNIQKDSLNDAEIQPNPIQNGEELCDVLIKNGDKYILIDCKSKEFIETIYADDSKEIDLLAEKYKQRIKVISKIKNGKFRNFFPANIDINNIYSLIVVVDDSCYSKSFLFSKYISNLTEIDKNMYMSHIYTISYVDLLEFVCANVNLTLVIDRIIQSGKFTDALCTKVCSLDKNEYCDGFKTWYKNAVERMSKLMKLYELN